jgi:hypothetical protein
MAGVTAVIFVSDTTVTEVIGRDPREAVDTKLSPVPVMVMAVPPVPGP